MKKTLLLILLTVLLQSYAFSQSSKSITNDISIYFGSMTMLSFDKDKFDNIWENRTEYLGGGLIARNFWNNAGGIFADIAVMSPVSLRRPVYMESGNNFAITDDNVVNVYNSFKLAALINLGPIYRLPISGNTSGIYIGGGPLYLLQRLDSESWSTISHQFGIGMIAGFSIEFGQGFYMEAGGRLGVFFLKHTTIANASQSNEERETGLLGLLTAPYIGFGYSYTYPIL